MKANATLLFEETVFFDLQTGSVHIYKWKNHFFKMKRGYRDGLKHQKGRNKGSLHSKDAQSYMTPSLYICLILINKTKI